MVAGFNLSCIGDDRCYSHVESRNGENLADQALTAALLGKKNIIGIQSDEVESEEEIIIDYTTVINGIKQIQLPTSVEKNSNIQYIKLKKTQINQKKLNYGIVQNMGPLVSKRTNLARVNHLTKKLKNKIQIEKKLLEVLKALNEDNKNISDLTISKKEIEISDLENQKNIYEYEKTSILSNIKQEWGPFFVSTIKNKNNLLNRILKNKKKKHKTQAGCHHTP